MGDGDGDGDMVRLLDVADVSWLGFWRESDWNGMGLAFVGGVFSIHIICMAADFVYILCAICCLVMCVVCKGKASEDNNMRDPILNI